MTAVALGWDSFVESCPNINTRPNQPSKVFRLCHRLPCHLH